VDDLVEAGADVEGDVDEETVGEPAHLVVAEEDVRLEETDGLVDDVLARGKNGCIALELATAAQGKDGDVADVAALGIRDRLALLAGLVIL